MRRAAAVFLGFGFVVACNIGVPPMPPVGVPRALILSVSNETDEPHAFTASYEYDTADGRHIVEHPLMAAVVRPRAVAPVADLRVPTGTVVHVSVSVDSGTPHQEHALAVDAAYMECGTRLRPSAPVGSDLSLSLECVEIEG